MLAFKRGTIENRNWIAARLERAATARIRAKVEQAPWDWFIDPIEPRRDSRQQYVTYHDWLRVDCYTYHLRARLQCMGLM